MPQQEPVPERLLSFADKVFEEDPSPPIPPPSDGRKNDLGDGLPIDFEIVDLRFGLVRGKIPEIDDDFGYG